MLACDWERWVVRSERRVLAVGIEWGGVAERDLRGLGSGTSRTEHKRLYTLWVSLATSPVAWTPSFASTLH